MEVESSFKRQLAAGDPLIGTMVVELHNASVARMLATAGLDFAIIDMEHGTFTYESMQQIVVTARACGLRAVVRIPEIRRETILKPLDVGAHALLIPQVNDVHQIEEVVLHAKYRPWGNRGTALGRGHCDYRSVDASIYLPEANDATAIIVQIETERAVDNVEHLITTQGVDAAFIGPMDLSVDMGVPGQTAHPKVSAAIDTVITAGQRHGIPIGIQLFDASAFGRIVTRGVQFVSFSTDVQLIMGQLSAAVSEFRTTCAR